MDKDPDSYMQAFPKPESNDKSARSHKNLADIFKESIPNYVEGWQLDKEYGQKMEKLWPAGEQAAHDRLNRFFDKQKEYGIENYKENRNRPDLNASSRLSPYIACMCCE